LTNLLYPPAVGATVEESGTVKWYNVVKGFGFIASDRGGKDTFVHASARDRARIAGLTDGQRSQELSTFQKQVRSGSECCHAPEHTPPYRRGSASGIVGLMRVM
jgi:cold shock CspA family protein